MAQFTSLQDRIRSRSQNGASLLDYVLLVSLVALATIGAVSYFGKNVKCLALVDAGGVNGKSFRTEFGSCGTGVVFDIDGDGCVGVSDFGRLRSECPVVLAAYMSVP